MPLNEENQCGKFKVAITVQIDISVRGFAVEHQVDCCSGCQTGDNIGIRPQARRDVVELATYIGQDNVTAANRVLDACEATFKFLVESPQFAAIYPTKNLRLAELRVFRVRGSALPSLDPAYVLRAGS